MANIRKFYLYVCLIWFTLWQPIIVIFWMENDVSLTQIFLIKALHSFAMVLLEVPTGALADYLGTRLTLLGAALVYVLSLAIYAIGQGFEAFLIAELIAGVGTALVSGTDSAFVHDSLNMEGAAERFTEMMGKTRALRLVSQVVASLLGGFVAGFSTRLTLVLTIPPTLGGAAVAYAFQEPRVTSAQKSRPWWQILRDGFTFMRTAPGMRWFTLYTAGLAVIELCIFWLYQPYMQVTGLSLVHFGLAATVFHLVAAAAAYHARHIQRYCGDRNLLMAMPLVLTLTLWLMSRILSPFSFLWITGLQVIRGIRTPILNRYFLDQAAADQKATVISLVSLLTRLGFLCLSPAVGWFSDTLGIPATLHAMSWGAAAFFVAVALGYRTAMRDHATALP